MESSKKSSLKQAMVFKEETVSEESGWTMYLDDFLSAENRNPSDCSFGFEGSSMASDAASGAALKISNKSSMPKNCPSLSFKKKRTRGILDDDPLEDTASSPVSSPKVSGVMQLAINSKNKNDNLGNSQEKEHIRLEFQKEDIEQELGFAERDDQCTDLKKRGLCLIPLSMLSNYLG